MGRGHTNTDTHGHVDSMTNSAQRAELVKTLPPKNTHGCKAPKSIISNCFCTKQGLRGIFGKSGAYKFKYTINHQTPIKAKYGAFYLKLYSRNLNIKAKSEVKPLKTCRKYLKKIN